MKRIVYLAFCFLLTGMIQPRTSKVIFFGDSITQAGVQKGGYITLIDSLCKSENKTGQFEFIGSGIGGNKVYDLYLRMQQDVLDKKPDIVVIYVGVNDVWHKSSFGTGTDADKFGKFYQAIIDKLIERGIKVIVCTPAVIGEKTDNSNQQDGDLNAYSSIIRTVAATNKIPLVDLRKTFLDYNLIHNKTNAEKGILTTDRVHLNAAGNLLVAQEMWRVLTTL